LYTRKLTLQRTMQSELLITAKQLRNCELCSVTLNPTIWQNWIWRFKVEKRKELD